MALNGGMNNMVRKLSNFLCTQHQCGQKCQMAKCWNWEVKQFTTVQQQSMKYAVLILNRPISQSPEFMRKFWNNASVRMTVDGGTMQWEAFLNTLTEDIQQSLKLPDLITGDFDSVTQDVLERYKKKGCKTIHTPDQNHTDFTKALMELNTYCKQQHIQMENIIAVGQNSGRMDQILGNIQTLFLAQDRPSLFPTSKVYIMSDDSVSWILSSGEHIISIPEKVLRHKRAWCCLAPIGQTCENVTTSGLKWNLNNQSLRFGELVSTSNAFEGSDKVKIKCSHPVLWSMKIPGLTLGRYKEHMVSMVGI